MNTDDSLLKMFRVLQEHGVYASKQFFDDIKRLVKTDIKKMRVKKQERIHIILI